MHKWILSEFFLSVTIFGAHHVVASVTGVMKFCDWSRSSSAFSLSQYERGIVHSVCIQNGWVFATTEMWNSSPCITLICQSKTVGYKSILSFCIGCSNDNIDVYYFGYCWFYCCICVFHSIQAMCWQNIQALGGCLPGHDNSWHAWVYVNVLTVIPPHHCKVTGTVACPVVAFVAIDSLWGGFWG